MRRLLRWPRKTLPKASLENLDCSDHIAVARCFRSSPRSDDRTFGIVTGGPRGACGATALSFLAMGPFLPREHREAFECILLQYHVVSTGSHFRFAPDIAMSLGSTLQDRHGRRLNGY
jgi:hypothetical protein